VNNEYNDIEDEQEDLFSPKQQFTPPAQQQESTTPEHIHDL
jgi:hypothetical protein